MLLDQHLINAITDAKNEIVKAITNPGSVNAADRQQYNISFFLQATSGQINSNCAEITFINLGTATATINGVMPLVTGASISISGNQDEIDKTAYSVIFAPGGINQLIVVRKYYLG